MERKGLIPTKTRKLMLFDLKNMFSLVFPEKKQGQGLTSPYGECSFSPPPLSVKTDRVI